MRLHASTHYNLIQKKKKKKKWGGYCGVSRGVAAPDKGENQNDEEDHGPMWVPSR